MWDTRHTQPKETARDFSINSDTSPMAALGIFLGWSLRNLNYTKSNTKTN